MIGSGRDLRYYFYSVMSILIKGVFKQKESSKGVGNVHDI